jgi:uncharacterized OB-fold protein
MADERQSRKEAFYRYHAKRLRLPEEKIRPIFDDELDGKKSGDDPFEVPDKMDVFFKYSYGGQSRFFREIFHNEKLLGSKCPSCNKVYCPPRSTCPHCYEKTEWVPLPGTGKVEVFTVQHYSTSAFIKKVPFLVAYVRLDGTDFLIMANIEMDDVSRARAGMPVKVCFREEKSGHITDIFFQPVNQ